MYLQLHFCTSFICTTLFRLRFTYLVVIIIQILKFERKSQTHCVREKFNTNNQVLKQQLSESIHRSCFGTIGRKREIDNILTTGYTSACRSQ